FYGRFCSAAHDIDDYIQQLQFSDGVNLNQAIAPDFWAFHEKTLDSTRRCYKYHQSQTFLNIFEVCYEEDAATKVEYIAQKLMPIVFERYDALVEQFRDWEKLKSSDTSLYWKNVMNVNEELELMGYQHQTDKFIKTLDHLSKIPHWIERLEQLEKVAYIFNVPRNKEKEDWLLKSIRLLKDEDCGVELVQIINIFEFLDKNLSTVNENCWKLITELSNADNFIDFLKNIADHDITNLINGVDDHSDENLIQEDTVTSLIQVKQFLMCLMKKNMDTVADVLKVLLNVIKTNPTLGDKISLCSNSNMALQNMYNNISNRGEVTKEKIKNAVKNGIYTFKRDEKEGDKCQVILEYTSKTNMQYNLNEIFDLRGGALLIATPKTTVRINDDCVVNDKDEEMSNIIDDFIVQVDTAQEIFNVGSVLIQMGHFGYRIYEQKLHGTESMINYLKSLKNELDEWKEIVDKAHEFCYYLTFFSSRHILAFYDYFTSEKLDKENNEECKILIRFVNSKAQLPPREGVQKIPHESNDYLEILCVIGNELERIFKNVPKQSRKLKALGQHVKSDIVTKGKLFVAACNNASLVSNIIMSLFANHGSYPEPWQLLICTSSTTIEEFTIFIKRSFFASNNGYENHLFCIANLELLDFELQYSLVNQIKSMRDQTGKYLLALICCREAGMHHHILDQFSLDVHVTNGLSTETMIEIYHNLCKNVIAVSSDLSGQGKTEWIKESSYKKKKITHSFLISDGIEYNRLVHQFKKCKLLPIESLHINIVSPDHPEDVNMFLFELLTLGIVSTNDNIACLPSSETPIHIFIEIASTTEQRLRSSLPMVGFLLSEHLSWNISNLKISREIHSPIQIVCHYLNLYESMEIDTKEILFRTDDAIKEPLPL
ncbi:13146_t:CDS:2, partial [Funneliformis geosporum]